MSHDLTKRTDPTKPEWQKSNDAASRLKTELMTDAIGRVLGAESEKTAPGTPRVILGLANHAQAGWRRAKVLQRELFNAASNLELKFAFYGPDDAAGVRRCRITTRWISDPDDMASLIDRAECTCGCFVNIRDVLAQSMKEGRGTTTARGDRRRRCVP